jgi:hypothetical protein
MALIALLGAAIGFSSRVRAASLDVFREPISESDPYEVVGAAFRVSDDGAETPRAWVEVTRRAKAADPDNRRNEVTTNRNVAGLLYDVAAGEVRFHSPDGQETVCARIARKGFLFFRWARLEPTGACVLSGSVGEGIVDDGFERRPRPFSTVTLRVEPDGKIAGTPLEGRVPASMTARRMTREREK